MNTRMVIDDTPVRIGPAVSRSGVEFRMRDPRPFLACAAEHGLDARPVSSRYELLGLMESGPLLVAARGVPLDGDGHCDWDRWVVMWAVPTMTTVILDEEIPEHRLAWLSSHLDEDVNLVQVAYVAEAWQHTEHDSGQVDIERLARDLAELKQRALDNRPKLSTVSKLHVGAVRRHILKRLSADNTRSLKALARVAAGKAHPGSTPHGHVPMRTTAVARAAGVTPSTIDQWMAEPCHPDAPTG